MTMIAGRRQAVLGGERGWWKQPPPPAVEYGPMVEGPNDQLVDYGCWAEVLFAVVYYVHHIGWIR